MNFCNTNDVISVYKEGFLVRVFTDFSICLFDTFPLQSRKRNGNRNHHCVILCLHRNVFSGARASGSSALELVSVVHETVSTTLIQQNTNTSSMDI